ncbi:MAG: carboxylating nicotinate-nucleotide diphosphorylase [Spirochaetota bacterium]
MKRNSMKELIAAALAEDLRDTGDVTSNAIFAHERGEFTLVAKADGILCGTQPATEVFSQVEADIQVTWQVTDGQPVSTGDIIAIIEGRCAPVLAAERTALNMLAYLSGIASATSRFVQHSGGKAIILDTRKTLPGYRQLAKYAVRCGGGKNHRNGLYDMVLIKDNHIDAAGGIEKAVEKVRERWGSTFPIEVETRNLKEVRQALKCRIDRIMLDNMDCELMRKAVEMIGGHAETEASGNITLERVAAIAQTGVDFISVGEITHSVKAFDFSLLQSDQQRTAEISRLKEELGEEVLIVAHHYQRPEIVAAADIVGDSYKLAVDVSQQKKARYIIFCGVRFMAEGASILADSHQQVLLPAPDAGCPLADMITLEQAETALNLIRGESDLPIVPVVYMNARADVKALCGREGGSVCTSSNAAAVLTHYLQQGKGVFFFPDQNLGINTAGQLGLSPESLRMVAADQTISSLPTAGSTGASPLVYLWDGYCPVHQRFTAEGIQQLSANRAVTVISHPEVSPAAAEASDRLGSTEQILEAVRSAPAGSSIAIGTEYHFVARLQAEYASEGKTVIPLVESVCYNMDKTNTKNLLRALQAVKDSQSTGTPLTQSAGDMVVSVDRTTAEEAKKALNQMISIVNNA